MITNAPVRRGRGRLGTQKRRKRCDNRTERDLEILALDVGMTWPQAKEHWQHREEHLEEARK